MASRARPGSELTAQKLAEVCGSGGLGGGSVELVGEAVEVGARVTRAEALLQRYTSQ
jgi:hypothetical protein